MKQFTLRCNGGAHDMDVVKREVERGRWAKIPNSFTLGKIDLSEYFTSDLVEKIEQLVPNSSLDLSFTQGHPLNIYLECQDPVIQKEKDLKYTLSKIREYTDTTKYYKTATKNLNKTKISLEKEIKKLKEDE